MNDRQRLEAIVDVVRCYLPPDGISREEAISQIIALVDPLPAQPEQGCAECGVKASDGYALYCVKCTDLFTQPKHPPVPAGLIDPKSFYEGYEAGLAKRSWVGLTDEEIDDLDNFDFDGYGFPINFARAIEAKLKEKNT